MQKSSFNFASYSTVLFLAALGISLASPSYAFETNEQATPKKPSPSNDFIYAYQCKIVPDWLPDINALLAAEPTQEIAIKADYAKLVQNQTGQFSGNVQIQYENQWLFTEQAQIEQATGAITATGDIRYSDGHIVVQANAIQANMEQGTALVDDSSYLLLTNSAYGSASGILISAQEGERQVSLRQSTFTTCPEEVPAWQIRAQSIDVNEQNAWGTARNAQLRVFNVPIFYFPYFTFPLTEARKTGLLYPMVRSTSQNGLEIELPWYWNIAPNQDLTLTPRYMTQRGTMLMSEYRFLSSKSALQLNTEFLQNDSVFGAKKNRHFLRAENRAVLSSNWSSYFEYLKASDTSYIHDFNSAFASRADAHLYRHGQITYKDESKLFKIQVEDFQMLGNFAQPYQTLPRLNYQQSFQLSQFFHSNLYSDLSYFKQAGTSNTEQIIQPLHQGRATRFHLEPSIGFNIKKPGWDWQTDLSFLASYYHQKEVSEGKDGSFSRFLPQFRSHAQLHLERTVGQQGATQTLTPQIQYLYVPYREQSHLGLFDTNLMANDYHSLFRTQRFTGLDRIADAHQITLGASTSYFNAQAEELIRASLGQIMYLDESKTQLFDETSRITASNSELAGEVDFRVGQQWYFSSAIQYDTALEIARKARLAVEYRPQSENSLIQMNYRKVKGVTLPDENLPAQQVEQLGVVASWQAGPQWRFASHLYRDLKYKKTMDALVSMQYESCCWSVRVGAYRRMNRQFEPISGNQVSAAGFDNGISIQFMLTGLGQNSNQLTDMLQQSIFGYRRPFYLGH